MVEENAGDKLLQRLERLALLSELSKPQFKKVREQLSNYRRFQTYPRDAIIIEQGSFAVEFGVVIDGSTSVQRVAPDGAVHQLATLDAGEWFGEMTALSSQPASARVVAAEQCLVLHLDAPLFKAFYDAAKGKSEFRRLIDDCYRRRSLVLHLRHAPLLAGLDHPELEQLGEVAQLEMYEEGAAIAKRGSPADAVYLVRTGAVTRIEPVEGGNRIHSYYRANSSFGEEALLPGDQVWSGNYIASAPTHVVRLPRDLFERALPGLEQGGTDAMHRLRALAEKILVEQMGGTVELKVMVDYESVKGGKALVIDLSKCTRCNACVESCIAVHEDGVPRLSKKGNRLRPKDSEGSDRVLSSACYSCEIPDCMSVCDYGAIRRDARGSIDFLWDNCVGCGKCPPACPYDVIRMTPPPEAPNSAPPSWLSSLPLIGPLFRRSIRAVDEGTQEVLPSVGIRTGTRVIAKAIKCDSCEGLPYEACVYNCPCGAIDREDPLDLVRMASPERS